MVIKLKRNYEGRNNNLREVGEPHEVAVGMDEEGGGKVTGADKQQGGVHPEDCCVRELKLFNKYLIQKKIGTWNMEMRKEARTGSPFLILSTMWWKWATPKKSGLTIIA